ncbi:MAG: ethanolamine permease [Alphaproteobacteria bacterium]
MAEKESGAGVSYSTVDATYFEKRGLRRYAGVWSLWALGVAAVISGDFYGWNFGLAAGGFGGLLVATVIITVMYVALCYSIAEMATALPHTGGAYSFARTAMGPWGGFITGLAENMEYVVTPAVVVVAIGSYMSAISQSLFGFDLPLWLWWAIFYAIFVGLNIVGVEASFKFTVFICGLALAILAVFYVLAIPHFSWSAAMNVIPDEGNSVFLPKGITGVLYAFPFAIWFYLAIEELPLAAEESVGWQQNLPKGILYGLATLVVTAVLTLFLNGGIAPDGAAGIGASAEPLFTGFKAIFGEEGVAAELLALVAVAGLVASFHTIIFAYGRNIFSLSRAGYFPHWLSATHGTRKTPHVALIAGSVLGFVTCLIMQQATGQLLGAILYMAVFGAVIAYVMQFVSFIRLRTQLPNIDRPYRAWTGIGGAVIGGIIAAVSLIVCIVNPDYRPGVIGMLVWFVAGIIYFGVYGRHHLVRSPEEEFALQHRKES